VLSALVAEELEDGDSKIHLAGLTGGHPAESVLGREQLAWGRRVGVRGGGARRRRAFSRSGHPGSRGAGGKMYVWRELNIGGGAARRPE
jgi:hypothetical protein